MADKIYNWRLLKLQSLDLILCKGESKLSKYIYHTQRFAGASKEDARFTHVAGIVHDTHNTVSMSVQESTTFNAFSGQKGVQVNLMTDWLPNYNGEVYIRKLDFKRSTEFLCEDLDFWTQHWNDPYESGILGGLELLACVLRIHRFIPWYTPMSTKALFCSELEAKRLQVHGLLSDEEPANRLPPWMWCDVIDELIRCDVSELIRIK